MLDNVNIAEELMTLEDREMRFLLTFLQIEASMHQLHLGSLFFVNKQLVISMLNKFFDPTLSKSQKLELNRDNINKRYAVIQDLLPSRVEILASIQRKIERRSYQVQPKGRGFYLKFYKGPDLACLIRCKSREVAHKRGRLWAHGEGTLDYDHIQ